MICCSLVQLRPRSLFHSLRPLPLSTEVPLTRRNAAAPLINIPPGRESPNCVCNLPHRVLEDYFTPQLASATKGTSFTSLLYPRRSIPLHHSIFHLLGCAVSIGKQRGCRVGVSVCFLIGKMSWVNSEDICGPLATADSFIIHNCPSVGPTSDKLSSICQATKSNNNRNRLGGHSLYKINSGSSGRTQSLRILTDSPSYIWSP